MKIGVIDSDGKFEHSFFHNKKLKINRKRKKECSSNQISLFTHAEYVCAAIFEENSNAEIVLCSIINQNKERVEKLLIQAIYELLQENVDIIHLSIGVEGVHSQELDIALNKAKEHTVIIASCANEAINTYPALLKDIISVGYQEEHKNKFINYKMDQNKIIFSSPFTSFYQLDQQYLMQGNSFLAARITGILSNIIQKKRNLNNYLDEILNSPINIVPVHNYFLRNVYCFTNRPNDAKQIEYSQKCINCMYLINIEDGLKIIEEDKNKITDICLIDINDFTYRTKNKDYIISFVKNASERFENIVMRYPLFNVNERLIFLEQNGIYIEQFFL